MNLLIFETREYFFWCVSYHLLGQSERLDFIFQHLSIIEHRKVNLISFVFFGEGRETEKSFQKR